MHRETLEKLHRAAVAKAQGYRVAKDVDGQDLSFLADIADEGADALAYAIRAIKDRDEMATAIRAFMAKWRDVEPAINAAFVLRQVHGGNYSGPTLTDELRALNAVLKAKEGSPDANAHE